ncbi:Cytochrome P450 [Paraburkholderia tropica]|uniref:cytochrome P450 n=1 Tax=Paraburkholderia tropica TaxID=92647 RepID=UPI001CAF94DB|nr:cytochrome P450 [Paraburkholderia tropica]CAG9221881.1 Cytochrome P450 [Paraburkholderia tropica]
MTPIPHSGIDLWADEVLVDPYPVYRALRELGDVVYLTHSKLYALTGYDVIKHALADPARFSSAQGVGFNDDVNRALQGTSLASDPPVHTQLRAVLSENLTPRALRGLGEQIKANAQALVARLVKQPSFDAIDDIARRFPIGVVADLVGFQGEARTNMLRWGQAAMEVIGPMNPRTAEHFPIAGELYGYCSQITQDALAAGSVGWGVFEAERKGVVPEGTARHIIHQYLGAGLDTTLAAIGNTVALFGRFPDAFAKVRADLSLVPAAFNEVLRYYSPVHVWSRVTTQDVEIGGVTIPGGSRVALMLGAGNHDPRHYANPEVFDVARNPIDHLSFGYGPHGCAGQGLARMEGAAIIEALATQIKSFRIGEVARVPSNVTVSFNTVPVLELETV